MTNTLSQADAEILEARSALVAARMTLEADTRVRAALAELSSALHDREFAISKLDVLNAAYIREPDLTHALRVDDGRFEAVRPRLEAIVDAGLELLP